MRSKFLAIELPRRHRLLLCTLSVSILLGCSYTIVESYYESRILTESEFVEPADYVCPDQGSSGREIYDSGQRVRVFLSDNSAWNDDGGLLELKFRSFYSRVIDAKLLSYDFYIVADDERIRASARSYKSWAMAIFQIQVPDRFELFTMEIPGLEIDGIVHSIPSIEFRKVTGERTVGTFFC